MAAGQSKVAGKFAEVEILFSDKFGIEQIQSLPKAPGSNLEVLDNPKHIRAQLPASEVKALVDRGADITVLRRFILVEGLGSEANSLGVDVRISGTCSGSYTEGSNDTDVFIPDYPGYGDPTWVYSEIPISGGPGSAIVTCVDVHYEIIHSWVGDLIVDLSDEDLSVEYNLFDDMYANWANLDETETGITAFNGEAVNQTWLLWAVDTFTIDTGYIDDWWIKVYYEEIPAPPNDDCNDAIAVTEGVPYVGSTMGATAGIADSSCGYNDTKDVWHSYTPNNPGLVTISLADSTFDTTLAVFDGCGGTEMACNDDDFCREDYVSEIMMSMAAANTYLIRIAGYDGDAGDYTLTVTNSGCVLPPEPNNPSPANDVNNVSLQALLFWNGGEGIASDSESVMKPEVIYGNDDRLDEYEVDDPNILAVGDATVAFVSQSQLTDNNDGTFSLPSETYAEWYLWADPIWTGNPLCSDEPFRDQPNPAWCSGFLVAPDIIATAGHCACPNDCADLAVVFGFAILDANTPVLTIDESEIYYCSEVIARRTGETDWSLIRLDREVSGHSPLSVRSEGAVGDGEQLLVIGHPIGLPRKYAGGATVRDNNEAAYFQANLDTYGGSSGSAVLNANTLQVEGIVVRGNPDFVQDGSCDRSNVCPNEGCPDWEDVTRATEFAALLPVESYDVYFDSNSPPTQLVCSDINEPVCDPTPEPNASLQLCTTYYWRVVSKNWCGETEGFIWSFTTATVAGDFDNDCDVDFEDLAELVLYWLQNEPSVNIAAPDDIIDFADYN
ncbi:MAG: trypsin-like serine peptidase [Planctomycetota bacterium]